MFYMKNENDVSAFTVELTMDMERRHRLLQELKVADGKTVGLGQATEYIFSFLVCCRNIKKTTQPTCFFNCRKIIFKVLCTHNIQSYSVSWVTNKLIRILKQILQL